MSGKPAITISAGHSLARLPTEIVACIASFACTDGGPTASALSLVCRFLSEASSPYRYQSVYLSGARARDRLRDVIVQISVERRRVRDLFICDEETSANNDGNRLLNAFAKLLPLAAPSIQTITCIVSGIVEPQFLENILMHPLPSLTRLTLHLVITGRPAQINARHLHMPKLQHISCSYFLRWDDVLATLLMALPGLTRLDLAQFPLPAALNASFVVNDRDPAMAMPQTLGVMLLRECWLFSDAQQSYIDPSLDAFRPTRGARIRFEVVQNRERFMSTYEEDVRFAEIVGFAAIREGPRSAREWKDAWLAQPRFVF